MKSLVKFKNLIYLFLMTTGVTLFPGCSVYNQNSQASVPVSDIVQMSKDGVSSKEIIKELRQSHSIYLLKADQLAKLRNEGVQDSVINYLEKTHLDAIRHDQRMSDSYYGYPDYYGYGYYGPGFGWPYGYWGWGFGPTIVFRGGGDFHGGYHGGFHGGGRR
jgi:hypothetical protein